MTASEPPRTLDAQFERIHGELALVNKKLDHEAEWRSNELKGVRQAIDDLKTMFHQVRAEANQIASSVRVDLERQLGEVRDEILGYERRIDDLEQEADQTRGALSVIRVAVAFVGSVAAVVMAWFIEQIAFRH